MQTGFSGDPSETDTIITDAAKERSGRPIKIRLQPQVLRNDKRRLPGSGQYVAWKDVVWTIECDQPEEAFALRDALRAFFAALGRSGPELVGEALQAVGKEKVA